VETAGIASQPTDWKHSLNGQFQQRHGRHHGGDWTFGANLSGRLGQRLGSGGTADVQDLNIDIAADRCHHLLDHVAMISGVNRPPESIFSPTEICKI